MEEDGAQMEIDGVEAFFPPSSLPQKTRIAMVVVELQPGWKFHPEVSLSPMVALGPHTLGKLNETFTLSLPLEISQPEYVRVLASYTSAFEAPSWQELPEDCYRIATTGGNRVHVNADHFSRYQAQCSFVKILPKGEYLYFSVSTRRYLNCRLLRVKTSVELHDCMPTLVDQFSLVHHPHDSKAKRILLFPGETLDFRLWSFDNTIAQLSTPFDDYKKICHPLDEEFTLSAVELEQKFSLWIFVQPKPSRIASKAWEWRIEPSRRCSIASGHLSIKQKVCEFLDGQSPVSPLVFDFTWEVNEIEVSASPWNVCGDYSG